MIALVCPHCSHPLNVPGSLAGRETPCPACGGGVTVPIPEHTLVGEGTADTGAAAVQDGVTLEQPPANSGSAPRPIRLSLGQRLHQGERYELADEIARGGMGAIVRAQDRDIRREVAVKFMLNEDDTARQLRFVEEAQITGQLEHPNIVPVHELGIDGKQRLFFSMKMVRGRSLAQILDALRAGDHAAEKEYTLARLLNAFAGICNGLAYAHSRGVVHRDLKPANIMLGDFGEVYVMDWGLAKLLRQPASGAAPTAPPATATEAPTVPAGPVGSNSGSTRLATSRSAQGDATQDGAVMGTPFYMPPEQAAGNVHSIDQRSDVYSLGAILYELLTLQPPVETGGTFAAVLMRVVQGDVAPPERRAPERARAGRIPPELSAVAMKALARDPAQRYPSAEALRHDIERYLEGRSVSARQDSFGEMLVKLVKRNKAVSAATLIAAVLLAGVLAVSFWVNTAARSRAERAHDQAEKARERAEDAFVKAEAARLEAVDARQQAEEQKGRAETALADLKAEQARREEQARKSIDAYLQAARAAANNLTFDEALREIDVVLGFDPENQDARCLRGKILALKLDFPAAVAELQAYLKVNAGDRKAERLCELCRAARAADPTTLLPLLEFLLPGKEFPLDKGLRPLKAAVLEPYQAQIRKAWPGQESKLKLESNGKLVLDLGYLEKITDLQPLKGVPLNRLVLQKARLVTDLRPLADMPLDHLTLEECDGLTSLAPLEGMPLQVLNLKHCTKISDLSPLKGMPLTSLSLRGCPVKDLGPLTPATHLVHLDLADTHVSDLRPLAHARAPLATLWLTGCPVSDLKPLKGMPLKNLGLFGCAQVRDLEPLRGMPLTLLDLQGGCPADDLRPLEGMPLEILNFNPRIVKKGMDVVLKLQHLESVGVQGEPMSLKAADFRARYNKGEFHR